MSWLYSRALVEAFWAGTCSAGGRCVRLSGSPMPPAFSSHGRMTGFSRLSRFGMTCEPLTDEHGEGLLTWFRAGFRARTFPARERVRGSTGSEAGCGWRWRESSVRWDRALCSWRTRQCSLFGGLEEFSGTWWRWGMMRDGECWERMMPELRMCGSGSGLSGNWTTPSASDGRRGGTITENMTGTSLAQQIKTPSKWPTMTKADSHGHAWTSDKSAPDGKRLTLVGAARKWPTPKASDGARGDCVSERERNSPGLVSAVKMFRTPNATDGAKWSHQTQEEREEKGQQVRLTHQLEAGGALNPVWVEWLMGWPLGWTDLRRLEMGRFQAWRRSHGGCWQETLRRGEEEKRSGGEEGTGRRAGVPAVLSVTGRDRSDLNDRIDGGTG